MKKKALKRLFVYISIFLLVIGGIVYFFDPFYVYHGPLFEEDAVLYNRDYQMPGTVRNFKYDTVILGSSVAENYDSAYINARYDAETIKIIRASGSVADLLYYMELAHQENEIERVFWSLDIFALISSPETSVDKIEELHYLHTPTPLDDIEYLYNKDILLEEIPLASAYSVMDINTGGNAYNWAAEKDFSVGGAMRAYSKPEEKVELANYSNELDYLDINLKAVVSEIESHPDTEYIIIFPPYSLLWWDSGYVNGIGELYISVLDETLPVLCQLENVKVYFFQDDKDIVCDLNYYMDMVHFSPEINQFMLECIAEDERRVTSDNVDCVLESMRETYKYIIEDAIYLYYP